MSEHVAAVVTSPTYQVPPHACVVSSGVLNANQAQSASSSSPSLLIPLTMGAVGVAALGVGLYGADRYLKSKESTKLIDEHCYMHTANAMVDGKDAMNQATLRSELEHIYTEKYRAQSAAPNPPEKRQFADERALIAAAKKSVDKSIKNGLSPERMVDLLNLRAKRLATAAGPNVGVDFKNAYLREFRAERTGNRVDLQDILPSQLFHCADVKRYAVLYFTHAPNQRNSPKKLNSHYAMLKHQDGTWLFHDEQIHEGPKSHPLISGDATPAGALDALKALSMHKYKTTANADITVISQKPNFIAK